MQAAQQANAVSVPLALRVGLLPRRLALLGRGFLESDALFAKIALDQAIGISAEQDVDAAASHIGCNGHRARPPRLRDHPGFPLVRFGIEHFVGHTLALQQLVQALRFFYRRGANQHGSAAAVQVGNLLDDRTEFGVFGLVDQVRLVCPNHRPVRRDDHHVQVVNLLELLPLGPCGAGHA